MNSNIIENAKLDLIDKKDASVSNTMDLAETLVSDASVLTQGKFTRNIKLALKLTMLSLANASLLRMNQFNTKIQELEDIVFSDDTIASLDPKETIGLYKLATDIYSSRISLIKDVEKNTNWDELEALLIELRISSEAENAGIKDESTKVIVDRILEFIKEVKDGGDPEAPKLLSSTKDAPADDEDEEDDDDEDDEDDKK